MYLQGSLFLMDIVQASNPKPFNTEKPPLTRQFYCTNQSDKPIILYLNLMNFLHEPLTHRPDNHHERTAPIPWLQITSVHFRQFYCTNKPIILYLNVMNFLHEPLTHRPDNHHERTAPIPWLQITSVHFRQFYCTNKPIILYLNLMNFLHEPLTHTETRQPPWQIQPIWKLYQFPDCKSHLPITSPFPWSVQYILFDYGIHIIHI